jgi:hypothetical protein
MSESKSHGAILTFAHSTNKEILTFSVKLNYVISNTVVVFILYLLFAFLNINSVIRMVIWWNLSTNVFL